MLYALLAKRVVVPDGAAIYNPVLRDLLLDERYAHFGLREHLDDGTLAFAQRSAAPTFRDIDAFLRRDAAIGPEASSEIEPYLEFLDAHSKVRIPYDYDLTAQTFTAGIEGSLADRDIATILELDAVADQALEFLVNRRNDTVDDGYSRRTFAYKFAEQLESDGLDIQARNLRALASSVYHGAAAATIGVNPAYAAPFRSAAAAIHAVGIGDPVDQISEQEGLLEKRLPFPADALYAADADIIREIRSGRYFKQYIDSVQKISQIPDARRASSEFATALTTYLGAIAEPLTLLAGGRRKSWRRLGRYAKVTRRTSNLGAAVITLTGLAAPGASIELATFGLAWGFGGSAIQRFLGERMKREVEIARAQTERRILIPQTSAPQAAFRRS